MTIKIGDYLPRLNLFMGNNRGQNLPPPVTMRQHFEKGAVSNVTEYIF